MKVKSVYSTAASAQEATAEISRQLGAVDCKFLLFFASSRYDASVSRLLQEAFPKSKIAGCTTAGELVTGKMLDHSLVAMAFSDELIEEVHLQVLENIKEDRSAVDKAFHGFEKQTGQAMDSLNPEKYLGLVLIDGLSGAEEKVNERIGDLTNLTFIGGSSGDDLAFKKTQIYSQGKAYEEAAVLVLLKPRRPFSILKTQSFIVTDKKLTVTATREENREIISLNNQPATKAYAQALGVAEQELDQHMFKNPLGLVLADDEPFVRSPQRLEGSHVILYCNVKQGADLYLLNSTDIVEDTRKALAEKKQELGSLSAIINFNCILRTLDLKQQERTQEYGKLFEEVPTVGLSTYGESYIGHINQTATMVLFA